MARNTDSSTRIRIELRAHEARRERDYEKVRSITEEGMMHAISVHDDEAWWNFAFLHAQGLRDLDELQACISAAEELKQHPFTSSSPSLSTRVSTLLAIALQGHGRLQEAIAEARQAVDMAGRDGAVAEVGIDALQALIATLAESGDLNEAWRCCQKLSDKLTTAVSPQTAGKANWVIGNVAFLLGKLDDAVAYHRKAASQLSPVNDLKLWARFNGASAAMRLAAGIAGEETLEFIDRAETAQSIVQGGEAEQLQLSITRGHWLLLEGRLDEATTMLRPSCDSSEQLATQTQGEAHSFLGQALYRQGHTDEGLHEMTTGEKLFKEAGADQRASQARATINELTAGAAAS